MDPQKEKVEELLKVYASDHAHQIIQGLAVPDDEYKPIPFPMEFPEFTEKIKFGSEMKEKHFYLEREWCYLNHGVYGATLSEALEMEKSWLVRCEQNPVRFFGKEFFPHLTHAIRRIAKFIDADKNDVVFVQNATTGMNHVIQSVVKTLKSGDSILILNTAYGTLKKFLQKIDHETEIRLDEIDLKFPCESPDLIVKLVEESIKPDTRFAVFDHVASTHAVILPVKELVEVCHRRGVQVLIDGAHCLGSIPISMRDIGADYYVANGHKWLLSSKGCAVLYVDKAHQDVVKPLVLSWGDGLGLSPEFGWQGTGNYFPYLSIHTVLDFWEFYGPDNIRAYLYKTAQEASRLLVKEWGTGLLDNPSFFRMMVLVRLPEGLIPSDGPPVKTVNGVPQYDGSHGKFIGSFLKERKIEVAVKVVEDKLYVRVSVHVYNEPSDFQHLADAINELKKISAV